MAYFNGAKVLFSPNIRLNPVGKVTESGGEIFNDYENNEARGKHSSASGTGTKANAPAQSVRGQFNVVDTEEKYLDIVGNGESNEKRSNAHTLDKDGNSWYAGDVRVGPNNEKLSTEKYAEEKVAELAESVEEDIGNIETALDAIIAIQNQLMGVSE